MNEKRHIRIASSVALSTAALLLLLLVLGGFGGQFAAAKAALQAGVVIDKMGPAEAVTAGSSFTYTIVYSNTGTVTLTNVVLSDMLPEGLTYVTDTSGLDCMACETGATGTLTWSVASVPTDTSDMFYLVVNLPAASDATLTNTAKISAAEAMAMDTWAVDVAPSVLETGPAEGAGVESSFTAAFNVPMDETSINTDTFTVEGPAGAITGMVKYMTATMAATFDPNLDLTVDVTYTAMLSKVVAATNGLTLGMPYTWTFVPKPPQPDLAITKTVMPEEDVAPGDVVTYTVSIVNSGEGDATGVVVTDALPPNLEFGGFVDDSNGTAKWPPTSTRTITWAYDVAGDTSYSFTFTATVSSGTALLPVMNTACFTSTNAGDGCDDATFVMWPLIVTTIDCAVGGEIVYTDTQELYMVHFSISTDKVPGCICCLGHLSLRAKRRHACHACHEYSQWSTRGGASGKRRPRNDGKTRVPPGANAPVPA